MAGKKKLKLSNGAKIKTKGIDRKLTLKEERFCQLYTTREFFANGVQSYVEAYAIDLSKKGAYGAAKSGAYELLTKPHILRRIDQLLDDQGLNDSFVDKELLFLINQKADFAAKVAAIKEYNALKQRITKKIEESQTIRVITGEE